MRATSRASMPVGVMSYARPASISASQTASRRVALGAALEDLGARRSLEGERRESVGDVLDLDLEAVGVLPDPAQVGLGRGPTVELGAEARDGAVVDHLAVPVAPGGVGHL